MLINFRVDPGVAARLLPKPFEPKVVNGYAIAGICLIRLKHLRPSMLPWRFGLRSENAAHRFAVTWRHGDERREGVYIPRRDTNSRLSTLGGGRLFPGEHHLAAFRVDEDVDRLRIEVRSRDGQTHLHVAGQVADALPGESIFRDLPEASSFFQGGSIGYSATRDTNRFDGLELRCVNWTVSSLNMERVESNYFDDTTRFPAGAVKFDCALLMRGIEHEWHTQADLCGSGC